MDLYISLNVIWTSMFIFKRKDDILQLNNSFSYVSNVFLSRLFIFLVFLILVETKLILKRKSLTNIIED